ncbi:MAG: hypothetical protein BroJett009_03460 [Armatimonadota bacterium]|nr:MAG: hypothetical protein BroJett009_03460 [Armatimonadota bacterium]
MGEPVPDISAKEPSGPRPVRGRAVLASALLLLPVVYASANAQVSSMFSLLVPPVGALLFLIALNAVLRKGAPKAELSQADLIVTFAFLSVASAIASEWAWVGHSALHMFPILAESNPTVRDVILPNMPDWLAAKDIESVRDLTTGGHNLSYVVGKLPLFLPKYLAWAALVGSLFFACLCINSLMRDAWCRRERLAFPIIQLPVALAEKGGRGAVFRSPYTWIALAIMFSIDMLNGFSYLFPNVPNIPVKDLVNLQDLFAEPPLSQIGFFPLAIYPFMAAIGLFVPSDLLLSMIVFFLLRKLTHLVLAANGIPQSTFSGTFLAPGPPYFDEQTWGAVLALFVGAVWVARPCLREVWQSIRTGKREEDGGIPHRWAFVGLVGSFFAVLAFGMAGTLPVIFLVPYVALFLIFSVVVTRLRAQLGPPTHEFAFFGPNSIMQRFFGTRWLSPRQIVWVNQVFIVMNRIHRTHPMPYQLEGMKMGALSNVRQSHLFWGMAAVALVGFVAAYFFLHVYAYRTGQVARWSESLMYVQTMVGTQRGPDFVGILMTAFGFGVVVGLDAIRFRVPGFPLHPAGYLLSSNFGVDYYWFGLLVALLIKNFVQRYYGHSGYGKLRNVAFGILIAEYAAETIWMTVALVTHQSTYTISFNERSLGLQ